MEFSLDLVDIISLISGIASVIMAILAIWLSITFYKMSDQSSKDIGTSANNINNNVIKLEKMFDTMYSDTFGIVKETVDHMRKQVDKGGERDISEEVKKRVEDAVSKALQEIPEENISKEKAKDLVLDIFEQSKEKESEILIQAYKSEILMYLQKYGAASYERIIKVIENNNGLEYNMALLFNAIRSLANEDLIVDPFDRSENNLSIRYDQEIRLKPKL